MNDTELLQRFRDDVPDPSPQAWERARAALAEAKQETLLADDRSVQLARSLRRRHVRPVRWWAALGVAGVAAAITLTLALTGVLVRSGLPKAPARPGPPKAPAPAPARFGPSASS